MAGAPTASPPHEPPRLPTDTSAEPAPDLTSPSSVPPISHDASLVAPSSDPPLVSGLSTARVLPLPVAPANPSQTPFVLSPAGGKLGEPVTLVVPPEVAKADVHIAADGSFVQTSSALAARELKKAYDHILRGSHEEQGVIRSPYAITAVQDPSGNTVFRISHREPGDSAETPSDPPPPSHAPGHAAGPRRRARLSVHDFLPTSMFRPSHSGSTPPRQTLSLAPGSGSSPPHLPGAPHRKLRKQRSNPDLRAAHSSTGGDVPAPVSPPARVESFPLEIRDEVTAGGDAFSQVLAWSSELVMDPVAPSRKSSKASAPPPSAEELQKEGLAPAVNAPGRRPSVSTSAALSISTGDMTVAPFGENVHYTVPTRRSAIFLAAPKAGQLREMQSFESGKTARADDEKVSPGTPKPKVALAAKKKNEDEAFLAAKSQARFSTSVFDVLQTYRGLPLPSTLSELSSGATIKLSSTDSANPKDDPRFVIWGELQPEGSFVDDASASQGSRTDLSASTSSGTGPGSRRRSSARAPHPNTDAPLVGVSSEITPKTVMIAATVERWIAQLTSELNYDELLNFLLTYRTYIAPVDLCHLLICRFHWALEPPSSRQDDMVRRIVRVRTFIAIRYWLLTFFREDFLPNADLCHLFASWLNALFRDPALKKHADALSIVRKLKKIVRECKAAHFRHGRAGLDRPSMDSRSEPYTSLNGVLGELAQGNPALSVVQKGVSEKIGEEIDDSEVDLDFSRETNPNYTDFAAAAETTSLRQAFRLSNGGARSRPIISMPPVQNKPSTTSSTSSTSASSILLSQPLSMAILGHVKSSTPGTDAPLTQTPSSLSAQHSTISRALVNTIGRLGRWKRVLNSRSGVPAPHCTDVSSFDLELNATGDLLSIRGGVEEYFKMLNLAPVPPPPGSPSKTDTRVKIEEAGQPTRPPGLETAVEQENTAEKLELSHPPDPDELGEESQNTQLKEPTQSHESERNSHISQVSAVTDTQNSHHMSSEISVPSGWAPEIVSLDDYNLSDSDTSSRSSTRVRRLPRRLPLRRDFEFVRRSVDTVSSMGIRSHSSVASSVRSGLVAESVRPTSQGSDAGDGHLLVTGIQSWQIELIDSDDEDEAGDAEAALRRLEGQIDADRQREKDMKVGRWLRTAHQRGRESASSSVRSDSLVLEPESDAREDIARDVQDSEDVTVSVRSLQLSATDAASAPGTTPLLTADSARTVTADSGAPTTAVHERSGSVESSQMPTASHPSSRRPSLLGKASRGPVPSKFGAPAVPAAHRSFILMHRTETIAQQFAIIEAELFAKIKFEELISHQWGQSLEDVRDWAQFVKERARLKNTGSSAPDRTMRAKLSAILALRARFDLLVNFTASEVLLTHSSERVILVEKFIRIAWKAYLHNNFSTLVALMAGLQTRWVNQAMSRHWHKVAKWEQRLFDDLRNFTTRAGEFKHLQTATAALVDARPLRPSTQESGNMVRPAVGISGKSRTAEARDQPACVPFLGMYLAQLYEHERLPDFVDPTAPAEPVLIDPESGNLSAPSQPDVFLNLQALPDDLDLEPLINVHKQRLIAGVIKSFVAGQHLATNIHFEVDQKSWQKCFRLRSLEPDALQSLAKSLLADP